MRLEKCPIDNAPALGHKGHQTSSNVSIITQTHLSSGRGFSTTIQLKHFRNMRLNAALLTGCVWAPKQQSSAPHSLQASLPSCMAALHATAAWPSPQLCSRPPSPCSNQQLLQFLNTPGPLAASLLPPAKASPLSLWGRGCHHRPLLIRDAPLAQSHLPWDQPPANHPRPAAQARRWQRAAWVGFADPGGSYPLADRQGRGVHSGRQLSAASLTCKRRCCQNGRRSCKNK